MRPTAHSTIRLAAALGVICLLAAAGAAADTRGLNHGESRIKINSGTLEGKQIGDVREFLGIPYAAPPIGKLRWRPPGPVKPWVGIRQATTFGAGCAQNASLGVYSSASTAEDCLYLNVYAPTNIAGNAGLPVMLWFYGGGLYAGESDDYDGSKLASLGHVVVVTINYRLGLLGWMAQSALDAEGHPFANYGYLDQLAAMRWIRRNIAVFGGDPENVTLFGQSSGGDPIYASLLSPMARGLFRQGIIESDMRLSSRPTTPLKTGRARGDAFAKSIGCAKDTAKCLRALPIATILAKQAPYLTGLMVDGTTIPTSLDEALKSGKFNHAPLILGGTHDEAGWPTAIREITLHAPLTLDQYKNIILHGQQVTKEYRMISPLNDITKVFAEYPVSRYGSASLAYIRMYSDARACADHYTGLSLARSTRVYLYEFGDTNAPSYFPHVSFPMGAYHTSELQYLFPLYKGGTGIAHALNPAQTKLSDTMISYWTRFARDGNPNGAAQDTPWRSADNRHDTYMSFDVPASKLVSGEAFLKDHKCDFWHNTLAMTF